MTKNRVIVVGGGAAGMMAALTAAKRGKEVILIEKNNSLGNKLKITGGGRCNITNTASPDEMIRSTLRNGKFLYHAFNTFDSSTFIRELEKDGIKLKVEDEGRVFPKSNSSQEIINFFNDELKKYKFSSIMTSSVKDVLSEGGTVSGVRLLDGKIIECESVIIATGGLSYPGTGSTGDGYAIAKALKHRIVPVKASLVPLKLRETWVTDLMGISFENVGISVSTKNKKRIKINGGLIFTHFGISGPAVLKLSSYLADIKENIDYSIKIDLFPSITLGYLERLLLEGIDGLKNKSIRNTLINIAPKSFVAKVLEQLEINPDIPLNQLSKVDRNKVLTYLKEFPATVIGSMGFKEAIITAGGVDVKEINPMTMESKIIMGLYFAGEVMDVDALTGGYNLHIAFSTGYIAGLRA